MFVVILNFDSYVAGCFSTKDLAQEFIEKTKFETLNGSPTDDYRIEEIKVDEHVNDKVNRLHVYASLANGKIKELSTSINDKIIKNEFCEDDLYNELYKDEHAVAFTGSFAVNENETPNMVINRIKSTILAEYKALKKD